MSQRDGEKLLGKNSNNLEFATCPLFILIQGNICNVKSLWKKLVQISVFL